MASVGISSTSDTCLVVMLSVADAPAYTPDGWPETATTMGKLTAPDELVGTALTEDTVPVTALVAPSTVMATLCPFLTCETSVSSTVASTTKVFVDWTTTWLDELDELELEVELDAVPEPLEPPLPPLLLLELLPQAASTTASAITLTNTTAIRLIDALTLV